jgi:signal transduction histidine kinase
MSADRIKILLVEDSPEDAEINLLELHRAGFEPVATRVDNEEDYLALLDSGVELILADYRLPGFDGLRALDLLRERKLDIPFIVISGVIGEETAVEAIRRGAADYLLKDRLARLGPAIRAALEAKRSRDQERAATETLRRSREQLRALARRTLSLREQEAARMAREMHDVLGQNLTALNLDLAWLERRLRTMAGGGVESLVTKLGQMAGLVEASTRQVAQFCAELRPGILDELGLVSAIEWQSRRFTQRSEIPCDLELPKQGIVVNEDCATAVFRIYQEILTNVARHADASRVATRLVREDRDLVLEVTDNGRGISPDQGFSSSSLGILGMHERALAVGGSITLRGIPGRGTVVRLRVPMGVSPS